MACHWPVIENGFYSSTYDTITGVTDHYTYRVTWSADDNEHVGLCAEFPSLSWLAPTPDEAFSGIRKLVSDALDDMRATNETAPTPMAEGRTAGSSWCEFPRKPTAPSP